MRTNLATSSASEAADVHVREGGRAVNVNRPDNQPRSAQALFVLPFGRCPMKNPTGASIPRGYVNMSRRQ
jgi:hypothetical protein